MRFKLSLLLALIAFLSSCSEKRSAQDEATPTERKAPGEEDSKAEVEESEASAEADQKRAANRKSLEDLVSANQAFAFDMHRAIDQPNFVYSPHGISVALGSLAAGMGGESGEAIETVFHFDAVDREDLHEKFYRLSRDLEARERADEEGRGVRLKVTNAIWPGQGMRFTTEFQKVAEDQYLMKPKFLDFEKSPQESRKTINEFVADATSDKIPEFLPQGVIDPGTRLVITNAVYFNAAWQSPFSKAGTRDGTFRAPDGVVQVPMMSQEGWFGFLEADTYKFIELPYVGGEVVTYVLLPDEGKFDAVDRSLTPQKFEWMRKNLRTNRISVKLPKFEIRSNLDAKEMLEGMGMKATIQKPDFTPMFVNPDPELAISAILHEAFLSVDEAGTEAAAATGIAAGTTGMPAPAEKEFHADRPFTYFVVDKPTGAILFVARVTNPAD